VERSKEKGGRTLDKEPLRSPAHSFLKNRELLNPAEQSAQAKMQLTQILPLYKANRPIRSIDNTKVVGIVHRLTSFQRSEERLAKFISKIDAKFG
jgi:hypothetical protein